MQAFEPFVRATVAGLPRPARIERTRLAVEGEQAVDTTVEVRRAIPLSEIPGVGHQSFVRWASRSARIVGCRGSAARVARTCVAVRTRAAAGHTTARALRICAAVRAGVAVGSAAAMRVPAGSSARAGSSGPARVGTVAGPCGTVPIGDARLVGTAGNVAAATGQSCSGAVDHERVKESGHRYLVKRSSASLTPSGP